MHSSHLWVLVDAGDVKYGGWVSGTAHLALCLAQLQQPYVIVKLAKNYHPGPHPYAMSLTYQRWPLSKLLYAARSQHSGRCTVIVTATGKPKAALTAHLMQHGAAAILWDPNDAGWVARAIDKLGGSVSGQPIATRTIMMEWIRQHLTSAPAPLYWPHPYVTARPGGLVGTQRQAGVTLSRVDWDKHLNVVLQANALLAPEQQIDIYGAENRLYTHHKLSKEFPQWRQHYKGAFRPDEAITIARHAQRVIDASIIQEDGGGVQYTFLEAWDAQAELLIQRAWLLPNGELRDGYNCRAFGDAEELAALMRTPVEATIIRNGWQTMQAHTPTAIKAHLQALYKSGVTA